GAVGGAAGGAVLHRALFQLADELDVGEGRGALVGEDQRVGDIVADLHGVGLVKAVEHEGRDARHLGAGVGGGRGGAGAAGGRWGVDLADGGGVVADGHGLGGPRREGADVPGDVVAGDAPAVAGAHEGGAGGDRALQHGAGRGRVAGVG